MRISWFILLCILASSPLFGQTQEEKLALQYMAEEKYDLAKPFLEKIYESEPENFDKYDRYLKCLLELKEFEKAEKVIKKRLKKQPGNWNFRVDEGYVLQKAGDENGSENIYRKIVQDLNHNYLQYYQVAEAFRLRNRTDYVIATLEKGEEQFPEFTEFSNQLAGLYLETGNRARGIEKYTEMVLNSGLPVDQAKALLDMHLTDSMDLVLLRNSLLRRIQEAPESDALSELLKWTFIKQKDWQAAYVQTKALDKRLREDGLRMLELAELCISNQEWAVAAQCYEYVKSLGSGKSYFYEAVSGHLEARFLLINHGAVAQPEIETLRNELTAFLAERGFSENTWKVVNALSGLYTRHLHTPDAAAELLEKFISAPGIKPMTIARAKLVLGDAYVMDGDVWSSELLYAQVEKDYPEEAIGQEAKFKRARLSYFRGDFEWAQIQLHVLKGATTQLISNNAIELSLRISENLGIDSNFHAMGLFASSELLLEQNQAEKAEMLLDSIVLLYPGHALSDDILYTRAKIRTLQGRFSEAAELYETLSIAYSHDLLADNALFNLGMLYTYQLKNPDKAREYFKKIIMEHPGSLLLPEARRHYRMLRGDQI